MRDGRKGGEERKEKGMWIKVGLWCWAVVLVVGLLKTKDRSSHISSHFAYFLVQSLAFLSNLARSVW